MAAVRLGYSSVRGAQCSACHGIIPTNYILNAAPPLVFQAGGGAELGQPTSGFNLIKVKRQTGMRL